MKIVRRIIAIIVLLLVVFAVGYLFYTGSRFAPENAGQRVLEVVYGKTI